MRKLKQLATNTKVMFATLVKPVTDFYKKNRDLLGNLVNTLSILAIIIGVIALISLIYNYVRPVKTADIKVPVATDQASYYPGEEISGIFFGEIFYRGEVRVLREVFCKNYTNIIEPPETARNGDFYDTQSIPRKIEGLSVTIGLLPKNIPVGSNCVLQFTNVYRVQTPFGVRHIEYQYYTQNFSIVTRERRQQLECEASGRKDCNFLSGDQERENAPQDTETPHEQESVDSAKDTMPPQNIYYDNRSTTDYNETTVNPPAPKLEERCTINMLGVKLGCKQVPVE